MDKQQITGYIAVSVDGGDALLLRRLVSRNKSNSSRAKFCVYTGWCPPSDHWALWLSPLKACWTSYLTNRSRVASQPVQEFLGYECSPCHCSLVNAPPSKANPTLSSCSAALMGGSVHSGHAPDSVMREGSMKPDRQWALRQVSHDEPSHITTRNSISQECKIWNNFILLVALGLLWKESFQFKNHI